MSLPCLNASNPDTLDQHTPRRLATWLGRQFPDSSAASANARDDAAQVVAIARGGRRDYLERSFAAARCVALADDRAADELIHRLRRARPAARDTNNPLLA